MRDDSILRFEPDTQLTFDKRSGEVPVHAALRLYNDSSEKDVLFRVQTTSPATYRVRPSHGRIAAGGQTEVQVVMVSDPVKADKFLVKWVVVPHGTPQDDFMKQFQEAEETLQERRLRVNLIAAEEPSPSPSVSASVTASEKPEENGGQGMEALVVELREAKAKIQVLVTKNQELAKALEEGRSGKDGKDLRNRSTLSAPSDEPSSHPATKLGRGISETELDQLISAQAGFPPVLVVLIALFAFLLGLLF